MADISVAADEVSSGRFALAPNQVSTVTFARNIGSVQIVSDGSAAVYVTVDGRTPAIDSRITYELPLGPSSVLQIDTVNTAAGADVVKLISTGTPSVRVEQQ